ncbi:pyocin activator PrtN family protein [Teredinibacter purpureus]|uniref:pyocin activator PrtN family protein n=1 Tax=Teredinibacter purpureus TaxID=2731756 RepID=UPI0005F856EA|nr:pyocin activator PrtN family protein [Teredinibacter purpureus]
MNTHTTPNGLSTVFILMAEYQQADIPLDIIAEKYFAHDKDKMQRYARGFKYPFPVFRGGTQKSQWLVNVNDLANWIDQKRSEAQHQQQTLSAA